MGNPPAGNRPYLHGVGNRLTAYEKRKGGRPPFLVIHKDYDTPFPDEEEVAHLADEYATVENIQRCTEIYVRALLKLLEF